MTPVTKKAYATGMGSLGVEGCRWGNSETEILRIMQSRGKARV